MTGIFPTADHVGMAIVAASIECGMDPIEVATLGVNTRPRAYAYQALRGVFDMPASECSRLVGNSGERGGLSFLRRALAKDWFNHDVLDRVIEQVEAVGPGVIRTDLTTGQRAEVVKRRERRTRDQEHRSVTAAVAGDPLPGRSALDQRRGVAA